ncbi:MAG TPA: hypothetical protein PK510_11820 [Ottowia sp.]|nr:hypothetical protein [Ottowia sp.]
MRVEVEPGVRLFVDVVGSGLRPDDQEMVPKPTLLFLHGGPGSDHSSFRPYVDRFADSHQVLLVDHRGNGRSDDGGCLRPLGGHQTSRAAKKRTGAHAAPAPDGTTALGNCIQHGPPSVHASHLYVRKLCAGLGNRCNTVKSPP